MKRESKRTPLDVAERVHRAAIRLLRTARMADAETGVSAPKLSALSVLVFGGAMSLKALAEAEGVTAATMSKLVSDLEAEGLAAKKKDRADARAVSIAATAKGRALMFEGRKKRLALLAARMKGLSAAELALLDEAAGVLERLGG